MKREKLKSRQAVAATPFWRLACVCGLLVGAVLVVFGQTAGFGFVGYDDPIYTAENPWVTGGLTLKGIAWVWSHVVCRLYHPVTMMSLMVNYQVSGLNAGGYHLTNLVIHALSAALLFLLLREMTGTFWRSAFVAAVFAVHPLRAESVAWVSERKDVLAGFFFMLTIGAYVRYVRRPDSIGRYLIVLAGFAMGLLCKPTVVTLPFVLLLLDFWPLGRWGKESKPRRLILEKIPLLALAAVACGVTYFAVGKAVASVEGVPVGIRLENAVMSYATYLRQTAWPSGLAAFYPYRKEGFAGMEVSIALLVLTGITAGAVLLRGKRPWLLAGWLWYLGMLVPVIGIVQEGSFAHADRNTYLPQIGLAIMAAWMAGELVAEWRFSRQWIGGIAAASVFAMIYCGWKQTGYWRDNQVLWRHALECTSSNSFAHYSLGLDYFKKGELGQAVAEYQKSLAISPDFTLALSNLGSAFDRKGARDAAMQEYRRALEIEPENSEIHVNLGNVLSETGQLNSAIEEYRKALEINPDNEDARFNEGTALFQNGDAAGAIEQYHEALRLKPDDAVAENYLGLALAGVGRFEEAIASYRAAVKINPRSAETFDNLGVALMQAGRTAEAIEAWEEALEIKPDQLSAMNNLAWPLATASDASLRNGAKSVALAEKANQLSGGGNPVVLNTLAAAYAEIGHFGDAIATANKALGLAVAAKNEQLAVRLRDEIELYKESKPVRNAR